MKKHLLCMALVLCLLAPQARAEEENILAVTACRAGEETFLRITANGEEIPFSALDGFGVPFVDESGRTLVPLRKLAEALGAEVTWDAAQRRASLTLGEDSISLTIGERLLTKNGEDLELDTAAAIVEGRTYIPLRAAAEALGYRVTYEPRKAVLADCRLDRADVAVAELVVYVTGASAPNVVLDEAETGRLVELFNQSCMAGEPEALDFTDTVRSFSCEASVELRDGSDVFLRCRWEDEVAVYGVGQDGGFRVNAPLLYSFIHDMAYGG